MFCNSFILTIFNYKAKYAFSLYFYMSLRNKIISGLNKTNDQCMHIYNYIADYVIKNKEKHPFLHEE